MDDLSIQYQGFSPSDFARRYVKELFEKIHDESPSSSTVRVTITKVGKDAFKGFLRVASRAGPIFAIASGPTLVEVTNRLVDRAHRRLDKWKARRFTRDTIRNPIHLVPKHSWKNQSGGRGHEDGSRAG